MTKCARSSGCRGLSFEPLAQPLLVATGRERQLGLPIAVARLSRAVDGSIGCVLDGFGVPTIDSLFRHGTQGGNRVAKGGPVTGQVSGGSVTIVGIAPSAPTVWGPAMRRLTLSSTCDRVDVVLRAGDPARRIDWVFNYRTVFTAHERSVRTNCVRDQRTHPVPEHLKEHFGLRLTLASQPLDVIVGTSSGPQEAQKHLLAGFVEYLTTEPLPEALCDRVRIAISFALGRQLALSGTVRFDPQHRIHSWMACFPMLRGKSAALRNGSLPPLCQTEDEGVWLDETKIELAANAFLAVEDRGVSLRYPQQLMWIASMTPLDLRPAIIGSAIEAIRDAWLAGRGLTRELDPQDWSRLQPHLSSAVKAALVSSGVSVSSDVCEMLLHKVSQMNSRSGRRRQRDFFKLIELPIGSVEAAALDERNRPAHGTSYTRKQTQDLHWAVLALVALYNRIILKLGGATHYTDYSTLDYPSRPIDSPLGGPSGAGSAVNLDDDDASLSAPTD